MKSGNKTDRKSRPQVISRHGSYRFQTGMVTANLLARGLPMADAYAASREVRHRIAHRSEVTTDELEDEITRMLIERGHPIQEAPRSASERVVVRGQAGETALPRHIVLRDLVAVGLELETSIELADALERQLLRLSRVVDEHDVTDMLRQLIDEQDAASARRYALIHWLRTTKRHVVVLIGGATGTGKSTLALELAFRLGIRLVVSTDMIRETMRTVLPADVVPGLHDHSFRGMLQGGQVLSDPRERVLVGFRQQAAQVAVGVRAAIKRSMVESTHMVIEGTHLVPPFQNLVPGHPEIAHAAMVLGVTNEARHRARFPARAARQRHRDPLAYLDAFQSVRWIHDDLLAEAEEEDTLVLNVDDSDRTVLTALDFLSHALPTDHPVPRQRAVAVDAGSTGVPRTLMLVLDGLADRPQPALGGRTPLADADAKYLRMLAHGGGQGQILVTEGDVVPHTDIGMWALLGAKPPDHPIGRGVYEAVGAEIPVRPGSVVLRGNLATLGTGTEIVDRRAGRIREGAAELVAGLREVPLRGGVVGNIHPGHEHRLIVALHGPGLSAAVSDTDPGSASPDQQVLAPHPLNDSPEAARTAEALRELIDVATRELSGHAVNVARVRAGKPPANTILTRGAASIDDRPTPNPLLRNGAIVAGCATALGVGRLAGLKGVRGVGMTGNLDTDLDAKFRAAAQLLRERQVVVIHFKGTDVAAHDRRPMAKRDYITRFDAALGRFLERNRDLSHGLRVVVASDHGTSSTTGDHTTDPVPLLLGTWSGPSETSQFNEETAAGGALGVLGAGELSDVLWGT